MVDRRNTKSASLADTVAFKGYACPACGLVEINAEGITLRGPNPGSRIRCDGCGHDHEVGDRIGAHTGNTRYYGESRHYYLQPWAMPKTKRPPAKSAGHFGLPIPEAEKTEER